MMSNVWYFQFLGASSALKTGRQEGQFLLGAQQFSRNEVFVVFFITYQLFIIHHYYHQQCFKVCHFQALGASSAFNVGHQWEYLQERVHDFKTTNMYFLKMFTFVIYY